MIVSTSLIRSRDDVSLSAFQKHWLNPHGPLTAKLPGTRKYDQNHVMPDAPGTNSVARRMRINGFPMLTFDDPESRRAAHQSKEMADCNKDSLLFIGAVSRVISDVGDMREPAGAGTAIKQIFIVPQCAEPVDLPAIINSLGGVVGAINHSILEQGAAPNSAVPFIGVEVRDLAELWIGDTRAVVANADHLQREAPEIATFAVYVHNFL